MYFPVDSQSTPLEHTWQVEAGCPGHLEASQLAEPLGNPDLGLTEQLHRTRPGVAHLAGSSDDLIIHIGDAHHHDHAAPEYPGQEPPDDVKPHVRAGRKGHGYLSSPVTSGTQREHRVATSCLKVHSWRSLLRHCFQGMIHHGVFSFRVTEWFNLSLNM